MSYTNSACSSCRHAKLFAQVYSWKDLFKSALVKIFSCLVWATTSFHLLGVNRSQCSFLSIIACFPNLVYIQSSCVNNLLCYALRENYSFSKGNLKKHFRLLVSSNTLMGIWMQRRIKRPYYHLIIRHRKPFTLIIKLKFTVFKSRSMTNVQRSEKSMWNEFVHLYFQRESKILRVWRKKSVSSSCHLCLVLSVEGPKPCAVYDPWESNCPHAWKRVWRHCWCQCDPWSPQRWSCLGISLVFLDDVLVLNVKSSFSVMF